MFGGCVEKQHSLANGECQRPDGEHQTSDEFITGPPDMHVDPCLGAKQADDSGKDANGGRA